MIYFPYIILHLIDTIRFYKISVSDNSLVLNENGINYAFKKSDTKASTGFSILSVFRGLLGVISLLFIAFLFSRNRQQIDWKLVIKGLGIQFVFALLILKVPFVSKGFEFIGKIFTKVISFTQDGTMFLFNLWFWSNRNAINEFCSYDFTNSNFLFYLLIILLL